MSVPPEGRPCRHAPPLSAVPCHTTTEGATPQWSGYHSAASKGRCLDRQALEATARLPAPSEISHGEAPYVAAVQCVEYPVDDGLRIPGPPAESC